MAGLHLQAQVDRLAQKVGDDDEILLDETARGHRRSADADAARGQRAGVAEDGVLVQSDVKKVAQVLHLASSQAERTQIPEHQVVVGAAGDEAVALGHESFAARLGVRLDLLDVRLELGRLRVLEGDGQRTDLVVVRTAL